jgi:hypothetical protein
VELNKEKTTEFYLKQNPDNVYTVEPGYNDISVYDTSSIASDILLYQLIPHC